MLFPSLLGVFFWKIYSCKKLKQKVHYWKFFFSFFKFYLFILSSISFSVKLSTFTVFFLMKLHEKHFASLLPPCAWKFTFTHHKNFFILFQFLISFKLITPIVWYSFSFMRLYFASTNPRFIFYSAWKKQPSKNKFDRVFFIFVKHILDLVISYLYFYGVYFFIIFKVLLAS